jgi:pimeloyl-ACP methyl ester carboxylesterase
MPLIDVRTSDDRTLEVLTGGDPQGFPFVYHGGTPSAAVPSVALDGAARSAGLRLITYSRPGYGASTPRATPGAPVSEDVADVVTILDALDVEEFVTLGWSGGGPRALACAALLPDRCRAAATLAGVGPSDADDLDFTAGMAQENIEEFAAASAGVEAYTAFLAPALPMLTTATPQGLGESLGGLAPPVDVAALTGEFAEWLAATFQHAGAQGIVGWRDDGLAEMSPWGFDVRTIGVPVSVWQGALDAMVPYAHGQWLAAQIPGARPHLYEDEGHLSILSKLDELLSELTELGGIRP